MEIPLGQPRTDDEIYLARDGDVAPYRPVFQGDVFQARIRNVDVDHDLAMIISHPCSMREGPRLRRSMVMSPVVPYQRVPLDDWSTGYFRVFPLPNLIGGEEYAARLDEVGMVLSERLTPDRRVACLSETGVLLLQQRHVFADTRAVVKLSTLEEASHSVLAEAELLEDWNETLVHRRVDAGQILDEALATEAYEFDSFLGDPSDPGSVRHLLKSPARTPQARRLVRREIDLRLRRPLADVGADSGQAGPSADDSP